MSADLQLLRDTIAPAVALVGGLVGLFGGGLGIYYASTANRILLKRFAREEEAREVETRADDLLRRAHEQVDSSGSGSVLQMVPLELTDELDRKAAWKLSKAGLANLHGGRYVISVDRRPAALQNAMAARAEHARSEY